MIEIFRYKNKWRIRIVNETFEFSSRKSCEACLLELMEDKEGFEPNGN